MYIVGFRGSGRNVNERARYSVKFFQNSSLARLLPPVLSFYFCFFFFFFFFFVDTDGYVILKHSARRYAIVFAMRFTPRELTRPARRRKINFANVAFLTGNARLVQFYAYSSRCSDEKRFPCRGEGTSPRRLQDSRVYHY